MKSTIYLSVLLLFLCKFAEAASPSYLKAFKEAQLMFVEAAGDKSPTIAELDAILDKLNKLRSSESDRATESEVALLKLRALRAKHSLIESPAFLNNKGGAEILLQAKKVVNDALEKNPENLMLLAELGKIQNLLKEDSGPTVKRLMTIAPNVGWVHDLSASRAYHRGDFKEAMNQLAIAIKIEKETARQISYLDFGADVAQDAGCKFSNDLRKLVNEIPEELRNSNVNKTNDTARSKKDVLEFEKIKSKYVELFKSTNCQLNGK